MFVTENPSTVILYLKNNNTRCCSNGYIDLRIFPIRFLYV